MQCSKLESLPISRNKRSLPQRLHLQCVEILTDIYDAVGHTAKQLRDLSTRRSDAYPTLECWLTPSLYIRTTVHVFMSLAA